MDSVVLNTIKDITLMFWAHDPAGCTSSAPMDEYANEAVAVYHLMMDARAIFNDGGLLNEHDVKGLVTRNIIYEHFVRQFDTRVIAPKDDPVWDELARGCWNIYQGHVERRQRERTLPKD